MKVKDTQPQTKGTTMRATQTREEWLESAVDMIKDQILTDPVINNRDNPKTAWPAIRIACGWPGGRGNRCKAIGECWSARCSGDSTVEIFVSPVLADPVEVLAVTVHELIHAIRPQAGHKAPFKRVAVAAGLEGKMTATVAGTKLRGQLGTMASDLGDYPHAILTQSAGKKKQGTRLRKVECPDCGYICRVTSSWLDTAGAPLCPSHDPPVAMVAE